MKMIYIAVLIAGVMLAIISRKNYSKYKDKGKITCILYGMSYSVYEALKRFLPISDTKERIGKLKLLPQNKLEDETNCFFVSCIALCIAVSLLFTSMSAIAYFTRNKDNQSELVLTRQDYGGEIDTQKINLSYGEEEIIYELGLEPVRYTSEEFEEKCKEIFLKIDDEILGENISYDKISENLKLMNHDDGNTVDIIWRSDTPTVISSSGVIRDEAKTGDVVCLTARIEYYDYFIEKVYTLTIDFDEKSIDEHFSSAINEIERLQREKATDKEIVLPTQIGEVQVSVPEEENNTYVILFILGLITMVLIFHKKRSDLKVAMVKRDNMLIHEYTTFVNYLWLFLGTGMTIKNALRNYAEESAEKTILANEIGYYINLINSGANESLTYEELGRRLGLKEYRRLFMHISQNLRMGTKDIRNILEEEQLTANLARKEFAKKKGEEATTKLLIPMIMMLFITMLVVVVPALISF